MPSRNSGAKPVSLRLGIARLRFASRVAARKVRSMQKKAAKERHAEKTVRRWPYVTALAACLAVAATGVTVTILAQGLPMLRTLDGTVPGAEEVVVLDPNRREEMKLTPGYLYDRPVAAVHTGEAPVLLRVRLEETLLTASRDENGRVVVVRPQSDPGGDWTPRTIDQDAALKILANGGFCRASDSWEDVLGTKLPARRLPGGDNEGGRLLVFENKTIVTDPDSPIPDVSILLPEDIEQYGLGLAVYTYAGFYYINDAGRASYQPLHITVDSTAPRKPTQKPPVITMITWDFYQWDVTQASVHIFHEDADAPVNLQPGELRPVSEWKKPEDAWFHDPADGWVYYGQALTTGVMTPLLLRSYAVWPGSPLLQDENRYRLEVRAQSAPLDYNAILQQWNSRATLGTLGTCTMTNEAYTALFERVYPEGAGVINYTVPDDENDE